MSVSKRLIAFVIALIVPYLTFIFVVALNESDFKLASDEKKTQNFDVKKEKQIKKPKPKKKKKPKKRRQQAPLPSLKPGNSSSAMAGGGLSFGVPQFDETEFDELTDGGLLDSAENSAMDKSAVDIPPKARKRAPIVYPELARKQGISGYVTMNVLIDENGNVEDVEIVDSKPKEIFDLKADSTMRRWKFEPATYNGKKVKVWAMQKIVFSLN